MRRTQTWFVIIGVLAIAMILYAGTGIVYSSVLAASTERTLNTVVSHQNSLNTSFNEIDSEVAALNGNAVFNPEQDIQLIDRSIADKQTASRTIAQDDAALASLEGQFAGSRWLTLAGRSTADRETTRIHHARNALSAARAIATDEVLDDNFWHLVYTVLADLDQLNTQVNAGDLTTAKTTLGTIKGHVDQAVQSSTAPAIPTDLRSFMADMQTFVGDYGKQIDAQIAGDDASTAQYQASVASDQQKLGGYDFTKIGNEIDVFYKPLIDRYNSEIIAATS